jgi:hypothetical protein
VEVLDEPVTRESELERANFDLQQRMERLERQLTQGANVLATTARNTQALAQTQQWLMQPPPSAAPAARQTDRPGNQGRRNRERGRPTDKTRDPWRAFE